MKKTYLLAFSLFDAGTNFKSVVDYVLDVISVLIPILVAFAFIFFFWGLSKFILSSGNKDGVEKGRDYMLWGILALFILFSFRTIIGLVSNDLGFTTTRVDDGSSVKLPEGN